MVGLGFMVWGVCFRVSSGPSGPPNNGGFTASDLGFGVQGLRGHRGPVGISLVLNI